jgi:hypothetical protein
MFTMLIFLDSPGLGSGGTVLDGMARSGLAFVLFTVGFFDTSAFHFLRATCEASESGTGWGAYGTPICSRTQFKRPPFGMFATLRASCYFVLKLPKTLLTSTSISTKTHWCVLQQHFPQQTAAEESSLSTWASCRWPCSQS